MRMTQPGVSPSPRRTSYAELSVNKKRFKGSIILAIVDLRGPQITPKKLFQEKFYLNKRNTPGNIFPVLVCVLCGQQLNYHKNKK